MIKRVLGLDISSSCTGYCLLELDDQSKNIKLVKMDHYRPIETGSIIERLAHTRDNFADIINQLRPDYIAIEDIITYMPKRSSANTIIILAVFNRMIGLLSFDYTGCTPIFYNTMDVRRGLQANPVPEKEDMPNVIARHLRIKFPWQYGPKGGCLSENYDRADACAVALFHAYVLSNKLPAPIHIKKKQPPKMKNKRSRKKR